MSNTDNYVAPPSFEAGQQGSTSSTDIVTALQGIINQLSNSNANMVALTAALQAAFPQVIGSFTLAASASTTVAQTGIKANGFPIWIPTNASAAELEGSVKKLYLASINPGVGFTLTTGSGTAAAGTETMSYILVNPA